MKLIRNGKSKPQVWHQRHPPLLELKCFSRGPAFCLVRTGVGARSYFIKKKNLEGSKRLVPAVHSLQKCHLLDKEGIDTITVKTIKTVE